MAEKYAIKSGKELMHGYCFNVEFYFNNSYITIGFNKISAIEESVEYDTIKEGGGDIHIIPKYISQPKKVTFSKGVASTSGECIADLFKVGVCIDEIVITVGRKGYDTRFRKYSLKNCVITKCSISGLDALKSEVLLENFEVTYTNMYEAVDINLRELFD